MRVERRFYTEHAALLEKAEQKAEAEMGNPLDEQKAEQELTSEIFEMMDMVQNDRKQQFRVIDGERLDYFETLSHSAMEIAEAAPFDVVVETEQYFGRISFHADRLMFLPSSPAKMKEDFATLIREAESTLFSVEKDGVLEMSFVFPFTSETPRVNRK